MGIHGVVMEGGVKSEEVGWVMKSTPGVGGRIGGCLFTYL